MQRPNFVIIGAQKAGSTALMSRLSAHPDVWMPAEEQATFRDPVYSPESRAALFAMFEGRSQQALGIKCPDYLARPEVPARLRDDLDHPRLILVLRDPVQRALSAYYWKVRWGVLPVEHPDAGLSRILDGDSRFPTADEVLDWSRYGRHLQRYLETFDRSDILVLAGRDDPSGPGDAERLCAHLGIDPGLLPATASDNASNLGVYSPARLRFLRVRNKRILKWDASGTYPMIPKSENKLIRLASNIYAAADRYGLARVTDNSRPELSPEVRARLRDYFAPDVALLASLLGDRAPLWCRDYPTAGVGGAGAPA